MRRRILQPCRLLPQDARNAKGVALAACIFFFRIFFSFGSVWHILRTWFAYAWRAIKFFVSFWLYHPSCPLKTLGIVPKFLTDSYWTKSTPIPKSNSLYVSYLKKCGADRDKLLCSFVINLGIKLFYLATCNYRYYPTFLQALKDYGIVLLLGDKLVLKVNLLHW